MTNHSLSNQSQHQPDPQNSSQKNHQLLGNIRQLILDAKQQVVQTVNIAMVQTYWQIGRLIIEDEQQGETRAKYGKQVLKQLSQSLTYEFGKGYDVSNLSNMKRFYLAFPIHDSVSHELSWTHYRTLIRIENQSARSWYMNEAITENWGVRALNRQIGTLYYERRLANRELASKDRLPVEQEAKGEYDVG